MNTNGNEIPKNLEIRRLVTWVDETLVESVKLEKPTRKAVAMAIIKNPLAGRYQEDLSDLTELGDYLGGYLAEKAMQVLGISSDEVQGMGKGCVVGEYGEHEHAAAILHVRYEDKGFGYSFRKAIGGGLAIMMSNTKTGGMGASIDIPLAYKDASFVITHWDTFTVNVPGAPKGDEILVIGVVTDGSRPNARVPGLNIEDISVNDGQR